MIICRPCSSCGKPKRVLIQSCKDSHYKRRDLPIVRLNQSISTVSPSSVCNLCSTTFSHTGNAICTRCGAGDSESVDTKMWHTSPQTPPASSFLRACLLFEQQRHIYHVSQPRRNQQCDCICQSFPLWLESQHYRRDERRRSPSPRSATLYHPPIFIASSTVRLGDDGIL